MKHQILKFDLKGVAAFLNHLEDAILVSLLTAMLVLASAQILVRNFFQSGILWGDILVRMMVLWVGLIGASLVAVSPQLEHYNQELVQERILPFEVLSDRGN